MPDGLHDSNGQEVHPHWVEFISREWLLLASAVGLVLTSIHLGRFPRYSVSDIEIVFILFLLFLIVRGLELSGFFEALSSRMERSRRAPFLLVLSTMFLAMFMTNDVVLLLVVPVTLRMRLDRRLLVITLEILAANAGSALTPIGNPQNLYLYWYFQLSPWEFLAEIVPLPALFFAVLAMASLPLKSSGRPHGSQPPRPSASAWIYLAFLLLFILTVARVLPIYLAAAPLAYTVLRDRRSLKVDYLLLLTFVCFFGLTDNLRTVFLDNLENPKHVFLLTVILSQMISNVPATLLLADFTTNWQALLWGANVGGFGCIIGSLANLIAYRLVVNDARDSFSTSRSFLGIFHLLSLVSLALGLLLYWGLN